MLSLFFSFPDIKKEWKKYLLSILVIAGTFFVVISPWQFRNLIVAGHYSLTWQQGRDLLVFREGTCLAWTQGLNRKEEWAIIQRPYIYIKDPFLRSSAEQQEAEKYFISNTSDFIGCTGKGLRNFFINKELFSVAGGNEISQSGYQFASNGITNVFLHSLVPNNQFWLKVSKLYVYLLYFQYTLIIIGSVVLALNKKYQAYTLFFILTILYFAFLAGVDGYVRYRYPLTPIIAILTAASIFVISDLLIKYIKSFILKNKKTA